MKKLGFILVLIALFVCALAISVSAAEATEWTEITKLEGMSDKATFGTDGTNGATSRVLMSDGKTYPAYYIFKDSATLSIDFTEINKKGVTYAPKNVVRLEIPNGIETLISLNGKGYSNLLEVKVPEGVEVAIKNFLYGLTTVEKVTLPSTIKSIEYGAFYKIGPVESFVVPNGCESIGEIAFKLAEIKSVTIPSSVKEIAQAAFLECPDLTTVVCNAETLGKQAFGSCPSLSNVNVDGVKSIGEQAFYNCQSLQTIVIPDCCETILSTAFKNSGVINLTVGTGLKSVGTETFAGCARLEKIVYKAETVFEKMFYSLANLSEVELIGTKAINNYAFKYSGVVTVIIPKSVTAMGADIFMDCANLKNIYHYATISGANMYKNCSAVETLVIDNLVIAAAHSFRGFNKITSIEFPKSLMIVEDYAFEGLAVEKLIIPKTIKSIGSSSFGGNASLKSVVVLCDSLTAYCVAGCSNLKEIIVTDNLTTFDGNPFNNCPQNGVTVYVVGDGYEDVRALTKGNTRFAGKMYDYADFVPGSNGSSNVFIYNANLCKVAYDGHLEDNNLCVVNCERCGLYGVAEENPVHRQVVTMLYNGFDKAGEKAVVCTNEGCEHKVAEEAPALFDFLGHSAPEFTTSGTITFGYIMNSAAVEEYESVTGKTLSYGVFAVGESKLNGGDVLNADGTLAQGVLGVKVSNRGYDAFELKITGFATEEQKSAKIVFGAYVVAENEGGKEFSFMQMGEAQNGQKYYSASYNDIMK